MPMYNLIEYSSNYSKTAGSLWLYSNDKTTNFNAVIANSDSFKPFEYKARLLQNTMTQPATNETLKIETIAVSLKYLSNK